MKLHLNLALRRAVLAAMATMAVYTTQAEETATFPGAMSNGQYLVKGEGLETSASYNNSSEDLFIGGGEGGNANLTMTGSASITANTVNVGNSHNAVEGALILESGTGVTTNQLNVGCYAGQGSLTINEGASVEVKDSLIMGHRVNTLESMDLNDIHVAGGALTVGSADTDVSAIGDQNSTGSLNITNGGETSFTGTTIVGNKGSADGTINVGPPEESPDTENTLNLGALTVLGNETGATGTINIYNGTVNIGDKSEDDLLVIGNKGTGVVNVQGGTLDAGQGTILLGAEEGANAQGDAPVPNLLLESGTVIAQNLLIGSEGLGYVKVDNAVLDVSDIVIDGTGTKWSVLELEAEAQVGKGTDESRKIDNLFIGGDDSHGQLTNYSAITVGNTIIGHNGFAEIKGSGSLTTDYLLVDSGNGFAQGLYIGADDDSKGSVTVNGAFVTTADSWVDVNTGGTLTTAGGTTPTDNGGTQETMVAGTITIAEGGTWNANGSTTGLGTITNNGTLIVGGSMSALQGIIGTGSITVAKDSSLALAGATTQGAIANNDTITLSSGATLVATGAVSGDGMYNILVDANTDGSASPAITAESGDLTNTHVQIDISDASELAGKNVAFAQSGDSLVGLSQTTNFSLINGTATDSINWDKQYIQYSVGETTNRLVFTQPEGDTEGTASGLNFTKVQTDITTVDTQITGVETEIYDTEVEGTTNEDQGVSSAELTGGTTIETTDKVTTVELKDEVSNTQHNIAIAKNVTTESSGDATVTLKSTATVQETVIESTESGVTQPDAEIVGTGGLALSITGGKTTITGTGDAILGFEEGSAGNVTTTITEEGSTSEVKNEIKLLDVIIMGEATELELKNDQGLKVHSTHALVINGGDTEETRSKLTVGSRTDLVFGGSNDVNLTYDAEVKHYDEFGNPIMYDDGKHKTSKVTRESANHITTDSEIINTDVVIAKDSHLSFKTINDKDHNHHGETHIKNSTVVLGGEGAELGVEHDSDLDHPMQTIVFDDKSTLKGSGHAKHIKMNGGRLSVGNSPGELKVSSAEFSNTAVDFYFITDSTEWKYGGSTGEDEASITTGSGCISQLNVDQLVTMNNATITILYETSDTQEADGYRDATEDKIAGMDYQFQDGASITLITGNLDQLSGTYNFAEDTLPTLEDGLFWDTTQLFTTGKIFVISEKLEEPWRIANTLVSAGETVLGFGRLAETQGKLRKAGTTRTWGSAIALFDSIDSGSSTNGYDYNAWGAAVGVDHAFSNNTVVGVAFGCTWGENEPENGTDFYDAGSIDQDAKMIGIYGVHKFRTKGLMNDVKLSAFAAYGWFENDSTRSSLKTPGTATAEWDSEAWVLSASLSRDITTDSGVVFTPYVGVEYTKAGMDDFTENGRVTTADYTADEDYSNLSVKIGVSVSKTYGKVTPYANIAFISDVDRSAAKVTATGRETITGKSALPGRNGFEIGVGATWKLSENLDVNAGYSAEIRDKATEHNARVGIGYTF